MPSPLVRALFTVVLAVAGLLAGMAVADQQIARQVASMRAEWGWVCETGLDTAYFVFPPLGAGAGIALSTLILRIIAVMVRTANRPAAASESPTNANKEPRLPD